MAELKTKPNRRSVKAFLDSIEDPQRRKDCRVVLAMMKKITGDKPEMWGGSIVGFGRYQYKYASGREGEWFRTGFSPRKQALTLYIMCGFEPHQKLMKRLGKHKSGKCCLYLKKLDDVDPDALRELIAESVKPGAQMGA